MNLFIIFNAANFIIELGDNKNIYKTSTVGYRFLLVKLFNSQSDLHASIATISQGRCV